MYTAYPILVSSSERLICSVVSIFSRGHKISLGPTSHGQLSSTPTKMADKKAMKTLGEKSMNGVRRASMKTFEDHYAEPPPYSSQPPSVKTSTSNDATGEAQASSIPAAEELNFNLSPLEIPTPAECIAHLKLLHAFAKLRHDIGNHDGLFGIANEGVEGTEYTAMQHVDELPSNNTGQQLGGVHQHSPANAAVELPTQDTVANLDAALAERIREKRWTVFVTKAVDRFEQWWNSLPAHGPRSSSVWRSPITTRDFDSTDVKLNNGTVFMTIDQQKY